MHDSMEPFAIVINHVSVKVVQRRIILVDGERVYVKHNVHSVSTESSDSSISLSLCLRGGSS